MYAPKKFNAHTWCIHFRCIILESYNYDDDNNNNNNNYNNSSSTRSGITNQIPCDKNTTNRNR